MGRRFRVLCSLFLVFGLGAGMTQFIECKDPAAVACVRRLTKRGAKHAAVYTDGALRVSRSYCPMTPEKWQWVVCVSRNNKPVNEDEARAVARRFVLDLAIDEVQFGRNLTSVWFHSM